MPGRCWCSGTRSARRPPPCGRRVRPSSATISMWSPGTCPATAEHRAGAGGLHHGRAGRRRAGSRRRVLTSGASRVAAYAGDSVGGAVGLQLLLDAPDRVLAAVLSAPARGSATPTAGAPGRAGSRLRHRGPGPVRRAVVRAGFLEREPERPRPCCTPLRAADDGGVRQVCGALAAFDVRDRLGEIAAPVLAVAGVEDRPPRRTCSTRSPTA